MSARAYFLIDVVRECFHCQDDYQEAVRDLGAIPEVKSIEPIFRTRDLRGGGSINWRYSVD